MAHDGLVETVLNVRCCFRAYQGSPALDPRRYPMEVKELRVLATSVLLDSGSSLTKAALLLRHSDKLTTERLYAKAMLGHAHDRA